MKRSIALFLLLLPLLFTIPACDKDGDFNFFSLQQDIEFGNQVAHEIDSNKAQYPVLPEQGNEKAYTYLRGIRDKILNSGKVQYRNEFPWEVKIIRDDKTLNAFCTPGGHIYVYTGLIKYLDTEDQLAGVLGHEIAHADKRHTTDALSKSSARDLALEVLLGNNQGAVTEIAKGLVDLTYSRSHEKEADEYSVIYLCNTSYKSDGAAGFFQKMTQEEQSSGRVPEFLSTHPNPENRVQAITQKAQADKCNMQASNANYAAFKAMLP